MAFKAYDIRGKVPAQINPLFAYCLGKAIANVLKIKTIILGYDARLSGPELQDALAKGLIDSGCLVSSIGRCCTEEIYYASQVLPDDAAVMITASHNPGDENGFKIVRRGAIPISSEIGLKEIEKETKKLIQQIRQIPDKETVIINQHNLRDKYLEWILDYTSSKIKKRLKIVGDCGNGCASLLVSNLAANLPHEIILVKPEPNGAFPNGVPNPLLPEKREQASKAVLLEKADFGVAWDGDADRCFFYDEKGNFIEGYYLVGLLAQELLREHPGEKIIHDPRLYWNTVELVKKSSGFSIKGKTGHAFMKERMRQENAIYGGEMSSHHYFRDFGYCDSGMLPFLLISNLLANSEKKLSEILRERIAAYPCSGEINRSVKNSDQAIQKVSQYYKDQARKIDLIDGLDVDLGEWRFSLRKSNTEPLLRLNVESKGDKNLMAQKTAEILALLDS